MLAVVSGGDALAVEMREVGVGHEDQFLPTIPSVGCRSVKRLSPGRRATGKKR
jgi:hypothetical protein